MNKPLVSIIMNCYNSDIFLKDALDSIYSQTYLNWEIIFWDNASTDYSSTIAKSYDDKVKYFLAFKTSSLGKARNFALSKASGKYVAFLDCDDLYLPNKLTDQVALMEKNDFALSYGSAIFIDNDSKEVKRTLVRNSSGMIFDKLLMHYEINMQSVMIRRSILVNSSLNFETKLKYCPDHNLFMLIASQYSIGVIKEYIVKYRVQDDSLSSKTIDIAPSEVKFTLDQISNQFPELRKSLEKEFGDAYGKVKYYYALSKLSSGNRMQAIKYIAPLVFLRYEYLCIFLLMLTPLPSRLVLKILGR
jgi:glycosyltransferase involved in cell wall biosynthesis